MTVRPANVDRETETTMKGFLPEGEGIDLQYTNKHYTKNNFTMSTPQFAEYKPKTTKAAFLAQLRETQEQKHHEWKWQKHIDTNIGGRDVPNTYTKQHTNDAWQWKDNTPKQNITMSTPAPAEVPEETTEWGLLTTEECEYNNSEPIYVKVGEENNTRTQNITMSTTTQADLSTETTEQQLLIEVEDEEEHQTITTSTMSTTKSVEQETEATYECTIRAHGDEQIYTSERWNDVLAAEERLHESIVGMRSAIVNLMITAEPFAPETELERLRQFKRETIDTCLTAQKGFVLKAQEHLNEKIYIYSTNPKILEEPVIQFPGGSYREYKGDYYSVSIILQKTTFLDLYEKEFPRYSYERDEKGWFIHLPQNQNFVLTADETTNEDPIVEVLNRSMENLAEIVLSAPPLEKVKTKRTRKTQQVKFPIVRIFSSDAKGYIKDFTKTDDNAEFLNKLHRKCGVGRFISAPVKGELWYCYKNGDDVAEAETIRDRLEWLANSIQAVNPDEVFFNEHFSLKTGKPQLLKLLQQYLPGAKFQPIENPVLKKLNAQKFNPKPEVIVPDNFKKSKVVNKGTGEMPYNKFSKHEARIKIEHLAVIRPNASLRVKRNNVIDYANVASGVDGVYRAGGWEFVPAEDVHLELKGDQRKIPLTKAGPQFLDDLLLRLSKNIDTSDRASDACAFLASVATGVSGETSPLKAAGLYAVIYDGYKSLIQSTYHVSVEERPKIVLYRKEIMGQEMAEQLEALKALKCPKDMVYTDADRDLFARLGTRDNNLLESEIRTMMENPHFLWLLPRRECVLLSVPKAKPSRYHAKINCDWHEIDCATADAILVRAREQHAKELEEKIQHLDYQGLSDAVHLFITKIDETGEVGTAMKAVQESDAPLYIKLEFLNRRWMQSSPLRRKWLHKQYTSTWSPSQEQKVLVAAHSASPLPALSVMLGDREVPSWHQFMLMKEHEWRLREIVAEVIGGKKYSTLLSHERDLKALVCEYVVSKPAPTAHADEREVLPSKSLDVDRLLDETLDAVQSIGNAVKPGTMEERLVNVAPAIGGAFAQGMVSNPAVAEVMNTFRDVGSRINKASSAAREAYAGSTTMLSGIIRMLEKMVSDQVNHLMSWLFNQAKMDAPENQDIPVGRIIALYVLYQRLSVVDLGGAVSLAYLLGDGLGVIEQLWLRAQDILGRAWDVAKSVFGDAEKQVENYTCEGCVVCKLGLSGHTKNDAPVAQVDEAEPTPRQMAAQAALTRVVGSNVDTDAFEQLLQDIYPQQEPLVEVQAPPQPAPVRGESWVCWLLSRLKTNYTWMLGIFGVALGGALGLKLMSSSEMVKNYGREIINISKNAHWLALGVAALPKIWTAFGLVFLWVKERYNKWKDPKFETRDAFQERVKKWINASCIIEPSLFPAAVLKDSRIAVWYEFMRNEAILINGKLTEIDPILQNTFRQRWAIVQNMYQQVESLKQFHTRRFEPLHFQFAGACGIGKTNVQQGIQAELCEAMGIPNMWYPMNWNLNHWDGYADQEAATDDDAFVTESNPDIALMLKVISGLPVVIPMADLSNKGKVPKIKLLTSFTNNPWIRIEELVRPEALWRRRILIRISTIRPATELGNATGPERLANMRFTFLLPTIETEAPLRKELANLTFEQMKKAILAMAKAHVAKEKRRALEFDGLHPNVRIAEWRARFIELVTEIPLSMNRMGQHQDDFTQFMSLSAHREEGARQALAEAIANTGYSMPPTPQCDDCAPSEHLNVFELLEGTVGNYHEVNFDTVIPEAAFTVRLSPAVETTQGRQPLVFELDNEMTSHSEYHSNKTACYQQLIASNFICIPAVPWTQIPAPANGRPSPARIVKWVYRLTGHVEGVMNSRRFKREVTTALLRFNNARTVGELSAITRELRSGDEYTRQYNEVKQRISERLTGVRRCLSHVSFALADMDIEWMDFLYMLGTVLCVVGVLKMLGNMLNPTPHAYTVAVANRRMPVPILQHSHEEPMDDPHLRLARRCTYRVKFMSKDQTLVRGHMIGVKGNIFMINKHLFTRMPVHLFNMHVIEPQVVNGIPQSVEHTIEVDPRLVSFIDDTDAVLLNLRTFRATKDVANHFITESDLKGRLMEDDDFYHLYTNDQGTCISNYQNLQYYGKRTYDKGDTPITRAFRFDAGNYPTERGESGSVFVTRNKHMPRKFLGILGGGFRGDTYIVVITQEMLSRALTKFPEVEKIVLEEPLLQPAPRQRGHIDAEVVGIYPYFLMENEKSEYIATTLQKTGEFPLATQPAIIHDADPRWLEALEEDPERVHYIHKSYNKYNVPTVPQNLGELELCAEEMAQGQQHLYRNVRLQTTKEAIVGSKRPGSKGLPMSTSPGLPFKSMKTGKGKNAWITVNGESVELHHFLAADLRDLKNKIHQGVYPERYKQSVNKDETLPDSKILNGTRTIIVGDIAELIVSGELFGDIDRITQISDPVETSTAIGVDMESPMIDHMIRSLPSTKNILCFDVKGWDGSLSEADRRANAHLQWCRHKIAFEARGQTPPPTLELAIKTFAAGQIQANIILNPEVITTRRGMKSGERRTAHENSEDHILLLYAGFKRTCRKHGREVHANWSAFKQVMQVYVLGDDMLASVHDEWRHIITPQEVTSWYTSRGIRVTNAQKTDQSDWETLETAQFLKHNFKWSSEHNRYISICDKSIIANLFNWQTSTMGVSTQLSTNIVAILRFAFWHGEEYYNETQAKILRAMRQTNQSYNLVPYESMGAWILTPVELKIAEVVKYETGGQTLSVM